MEMETHLESSEGPARKAFSEGGFIVVSRIHFVGQIHFYPKWLTIIKPVLGLVILEVSCKKCDGILKLKCNL